MDPIEQFLKQLENMLPKFRKRIVIRDGREIWLDFLSKLDTLLRSLSTERSERSRSRIIAQIRELGNEFYVIDEMEAVFAGTPFATSDTEASVGTLSPGPGPAAEARVQIQIEGARQALKEMADFAREPLRGGEREVMEEPAQRQVPTYTNLDAPTHAIVETEYSISVWLSAEPSAVTGDFIVQPQALVPAAPDQDEVPVLVRLSAPDFVFVSQGEDLPAGEETILFNVDRRASDEARFAVVPRPGRRPTYFSRMRASFYVDGTLIAEAWRTVEILATNTLPKTPLHQFPAPAPAVALDEAGTATQSGTANSSVVLPPAGTLPVDLLIDIRTEIDRQTLLWEMTPFQGRPRQFATLIPGQGAYISGYLAKYAEGADDDELPWYELGGLTSTLLTLRAFLPADFWDCYNQTLSNHLAKPDQPDATEMTILIRSDNPHLPWELLPLETDASGGRYLPKLLGSAHRVGRWILGGQKPLPDIDLDLDGMTVVAPTYVKNPLPEAHLEAQDLENNHGAYRLPEADFYDYLSSGQPQSGQPAGGTGIFHFVGHGETFGAPHRIAWLLLGSGDKYDVNMARWKRTNGLGHLGKMTFAFFNACKMADVPEIQPLGSMSCWAAALIEQGYVGYVGPLWKVNDSKARTVAETFYRHALDAQTPLELGEILRQMRNDVVQQTADIMKFSITDLAYIYYGHPNATIQYQPFNLP